MKQTGERNPDVVYTKVQVHVPAKVDKLLRELCRLDDSSIEEFYQDRFINGLRSFFNSGDLLDLEGLAKVHDLHKALKLDSDMYGEPETG